MSASSLPGPGFGGLAAAHALNGQETLRRLAMIDEGFVQDDAGLGPVSISALDPKTAAPLQLGV